MPHVWQPLAERRHDSGVQPNNVVFWLWLVNASDDRHLGELAQIMGMTRPWIWMSSHGTKVESHFNQTLLLSVLRVPISHHPEKLEEGLQVWMVVQVGINDEAMEVQDNMAQTPYAFATNGAKLYQFLSNDAHGPSVVCVSRAELYVLEKSQLHDLIPLTVDAGVWAHAVTVFEWIPAGVEGDRTQGFLDDLQSKLLW